jgi:hypothetical protein
VYCLVAGEEAIGDFGDELVGEWVDFVAGETERASVTATASRAARAAGSFTGQ